MNTYYPVFQWKILVMSALLSVSCYHGHGLSSNGEDAAASSGISGTITFIGSAPDSTLQINPVVSLKYPEGIHDADSLYNFIFSELLALNITLGDTLPIHETRIEYTVNVKPGLYEWILVVWFPKIPDYYNGAKELGAYYLSTPEHPESVYVPPGEIVTGIDITADFANIGNPLPFFKP